MYDYEQQEQKMQRPRVSASLPQINPKLWGEMEFYLRNRELSYPTAKANGWYPSEAAGDKYSRIVMPATNQDKFSYWQARLMEKAPKDVKRYQSPMVPRGDSVISVWPTNRDYTPVLILTEGPMDALAAAGFGIPAVAMMGLNPSDEALLFIKNTLATYTDHVTFFCDRDAVQQAVQIVQRCIKFGMSVTVSNPTPYKDLAAMPLKKRNFMLDKYLQASRKTWNKYAHNPRERH